MFFYIRLRLETAIVTAQMFSAVLSRTTEILCQIATSSSIIKIAFEELNDEGSDVVFRA